jgi:hypothetical protein
MASVFISYARTDAQFVNHLFDALRQAGYNPWLDRESIPGSSEWRAEINKGIHNATAVISVLSPAACPSKVRTRLAGGASGIRTPGPLSQRCATIGCGR